MRHIHAALAREPTPIPLPTHSNVALAGLLHCGTGSKALAFNDDQGSDEALINRLNDV